VRDPAASPTLERAVQVLIVGSIVTAVLAAGSLLGLLDEARKARWIFLLGLAVVAAAIAVPRLRGLRLDPAYLLAAALTGLALLSSAWSSKPELTFARSASLALLLGAAAAAAIGASGRPESMRRILDAVLVAAAAVGVGGLLVLAFAHDRAVQGATAQEPARYQGLGGGPNTATMLLAVALPLAAYAALRPGTRIRRLAAAGAFLLLLGSIVASGSRGSLLAACVGLGVLAALAAVGTRRKLLAVGAVAAVAIAAVLVARLPQPDPSVPARPGTATPSSFAPAAGYLDANEVRRLQEDVGRPAAGEPGDTSRSLLGGSGRAQAWAGAIGLAADRPLVGYAFGLETDVFVDRYLEHGSNQPENSYVGLFLQLGTLGLVLFLGLVVLLLLAASRALRGARPPARLLTAAATGAFVAGLALALTQSFVYAAGNNASLAVWLCAFLLPAAAAATDADAG
jgi:hypothetical protein